MPPAAKAMMSDCRAPQMSCEKTSWPKEVVPSQWAGRGREVRSRRSRRSGCTARSDRGRRRARGRTAAGAGPPSPCGCGAARARRCRPAARAGSRPGVAAPCGCRQSLPSAPRFQADLRLCEVVGVALSRHGGRLELPRPRVEDGREHVADEQAEQHREGDEQEQRLHERVVEAFDRAEQEVPEPWIVEDVLDEDGARTPRNRATWRSRSGWGGWRSSRRKPT